MYKNLFIGIITFCLLNFAGDANANQISSAISKAGINKSAVSVSVKDISTGKRIYSHNAQRQLPPASTLKLVTYSASKDILGDDGFVKAFYALIKENCGTIIDRVFITGVCSISLDAMTSGFNIATKITTDERFNSMTALTHEEVKELIHKVDSINEDKIYNEMVDNYDGYKFNAECETVFNPTLTMYYLNNIQGLGKSPEELLDGNILSSFDQIKNIIDLAEDKKEVFNDIFSKGIVASELITNFDLIEKLSYSDVVSFLFYFGYLTIDDIGPVEYLYKIPNEVIEKVFSLYFKNELKAHNIEIEQSLINEALMEIIETGKIELLSKNVSEIIKMNSNRDFIEFNEKCFYLYLKLNLN